jgi:hypothetical protein
MSDNAALHSPPDLPTDPDAFFRAGPDVDLLTVVPPPTQGQHILEQLGPPPFRKTSFPMMGFLASVYEHVAAQMSGQSSP